MPKDLRQAHRANDRAVAAVCRKLTRLGSEEVSTAMIESLRGEPIKTITSDHGREFQLHENVTKELGVEFYFP